MPIINNVPVRVGWANLTDLSKLGGLYIVLNWRLMLFLLTFYDIESVEDFIGGIPVNPVWVRKKIRCSPVELDSNYIFYTLYLSILSSSLSCFLHGQIQMVKSAFLWQSVLDQFYPPLTVVTCGCLLQSHFQSASPANWKSPYWPISQKELNVSIKICTNLPTQFWPKSWHCQ